MAKQIKSCGVLLTRGEPIESFLLMRHADRWDLPKGHVDEGETEIQCALREMWEETGIAAEAVQLDPEFRFTLQYPVWPERFGGQQCDKTLVIFLGKLLKDQPIQVTEHQDHQWFDWQPPHSIQEESIDPVLAAVERWVE